jgi:hypothetical protein
MIVSHLLLILHKKIVLYLCLKPEMWQKVAKFKWAKYIRKALYTFESKCTLDIFSIAYILLGLFICFTQFYKLTVYTGNFQNKANINIGLWAQNDPRPRTVINWVDIW